MSDPVLLQLGAGASGRPGPGYINCDMFPGPNIDCVFDAMKPWPFADDSVHGIYASHMLEHLPDAMFFFREAYRVLEDRCLMRLRMPYGGHRSAWHDPTHLRPWYPESFAFLQPGYNEAVHNPQHNAWDAPFIVEHVGQRVGKQWARWLRWRMVKRYLLPVLDRIPDAVEELWVALFPVKQEGAQAYWRQERPANLVPTSFLMYQHEWERKVWQEGMQFVLLDITGATPHRVA